MNTAAVDAAEVAKPATPFPAGAAVAGLVLGFAFTRLLVGASTQWPALGTFGTFASLTGVFLGLAALVRLSWESSSTPAARSLRVALVAPLATLDARAMFGEPARPLQSAGLLAVAALLAASLGRGVFLALRRRDRLPAATLALLFIGEVVELVTPPLRFAAAPTSPTARLAERLGAVGEFMAFAGVPLALAWTVRSALRRTDLTRTLSVSAMPLAFGVMMFGLPFGRPILSRTAAAAGFGVRFDLAGGAMLARPSAITVATYSLLFSMLLAASSIALGVKGSDAGSLGRRSLAWACVLVAGFGAVNAAGPVDPLRLTTLALGALLLEQAVAREDLDPPVARDDADDAG
ncbi:MAG: hypothetical protein R3A52_28635 [Polyangiales bacterium]